MLADSEHQMPVVSHQPHRCLYQREDASEGGAWGSLYRVLWRTVTSTAVVVCTVATVVHAPSMCEV